MDQLMQKDWYTHQAGQNNGPYTWEQIRAMAEEGSLDGQDVYLWHESLKEWKKAVDVLKEDNKTYPEKQSLFKHVLGAFKGLLRGLKALPRSKKRAVPAMVLSLLWLIMLILEALGVDGTAFRFLRFLSFSGGGARGGTAGFIGGLVGKGIYAYAATVLLVPLLSGRNPFKGLGGSLRSLPGFMAVRGRHNIVHQLSGLGAALIIFNFLSGDASIGNSMVGLIALLLTIRAHTLSQGFMRGFIGTVLQGMSRKKTNEGSGADGILAGLAWGFAISIPMAAIPFAIIGYLSGALILVAAIIIKLSSGSKRGAVVCLMAALLSVIHVNAVSAEEAVYYTIIRKPSFDIIGGHGVSQLVNTWTINGRNDGQRLLYIEDITVTMSVKNGTLRDQVVNVHLYEDEDTRVSRNHYRGSYSVYEIKENWDTWSRNMVSEQGGSLETFRGLPALVVDRGPSFEVEQVDRGQAGIEHIGRVNHYKQIYVMGEDFVPAEGFGVIKIDISIGVTHTRKGITPYQQADAEARAIYQELLAAGGVMLDEFSFSFKREMIRDNRGQIAQPGGATTIEIDTDASGTAGEVSVSVPVAIVTGLTGLGAAFAGAAAAGGSAEGGSGSNSSFKMVLYKEFGNKLKYNADHVFVYARMVEITAMGAEVPRPDLTAGIEIFTRDAVLEMGSAVMAGDYKGASVRAWGPKDASLPESVVISFRYRGEGGSFQNKVSFALVGEGYIQLEGASLAALSGSGRAFHLPYQLVDFLEVERVEVEVKCMQSDIPFELSTDIDQEGRTVITAIDNGMEKPFEKFYDSYTCEIIATCDKEYARTVFSVIMCHEGLLPDFLGRESEINAFPEESGELRETRVVYRLGLWNDESQRLDMIKPADMEVTCRDEDGIYDAIGLDIQVNTSYHREDGIQYEIRAQKALPASNPVKGTLRGLCKRNEKTFENETLVSLIPDSLKYETDFDTEYKNCIYIIKTYLPENFRDKKLDELNQNLSRMGIEDLRVFRKNCWKMAERFIMQEKESYLIDSYWYDEAIATAELLVYIGDIAFGIATAPMGGPIAGFVISNVKDSFIELIELYVQSSSFGFSEVKNFISGRFVKLAGQADFVFSPPKLENKKQMAAWLTCFTLYRISYRWWFDKEDNRPIGLVESIKRGLLDLAGKGAGILMEDYVGNLAKETGWDLLDTDYISLKDADQEIYDDMKKKGADAVSVAVKHLMQYLDAIKSG